jgi:hypothetical protein
MELPGSECCRRCAPPGHPVASGRTARPSPRSTPLPKHSLMSAPKASAVCNAGTQQCQRLPACEAYRQCGPGQNAAPQGEFETLPYRHGGACRTASFCRVPYCEGSKRSRRWVGVVGRSSRVSCRGSTVRSKVRRTGLRQLTTAPQGHRDTERCVEPRRATLCRRAVFTSRGAWFPATVGAHGFACAARARS